MTRAPSPALVFGVAVTGIAIFSSMDAVMKGLVLQLGAFDTLFWRTLAGIVLTGAIYLPARKGWPTRSVMRVHLIRGGVSSVMAVTFFWGLARVPMAQAIALAFIAPLLALFGAALVLKERIPPRAIAASLVAFAGVGVIMLGQATAAPDPDRFRGTVAVLISAICYAYNIVLMRQQALVAGPSEVAFFQSVIVGGLFAIVAPFIAHVPDAHHAPAILLAAALATVSLLILAWAYARGEANYLAPTEYTGFIWASIWGWVVFREPVATYTLAGAALIITGCLIAARRRAVENVEAAF
ncbi:DMT family transporter [Sphingomonas sp.]|jgi:S-adenosylmethionine uptake transporter|uniref:DMT family transporter n=1 Tax=Sphingomonas sp. TaxID=28214 RepID=UPI002E31F49B|nr:DMT family transporter [Sphingomonas sp.]HEX4693046.1 DMT family transporter [Sphingomonas sp.]